MKYKKQRVLSLLMSLALALTLLPAGFVTLPAKAESIICLGDNHYQITVKQNDEITNRWIQTVSSLSADADGKAWSSTLYYQTDTGTDANTPYPTDGFIKNGMTLKYTVGSPKTSTAAAGSRKGSTYQTKDYEFRLSGTPAASGTYTFHWRFNPLSEDNEDGFHEGLPEDFYLDVVVEASPYGPCAWTTEPQSSYTAADGKDLTIQWSGIVKDAGTGLDNGTKPWLEACYPDGSKSIWAQPGNPLILPSAAICQFASGSQWTLKLHPRQETADETNTDWVVSKTVTVNSTIREVSSVNITVPAPVIGAYAKECFAVDGANYHLLGPTTDSVCFRPDTTGWYDSTGKQRLFGTFQAGETYEAFLEVAPLDGCSFAENLNITVNGQSPDGSNIKITKMNRNEYLCFVQMTPVAETRPLTFVDDSAYDMTMGYLNSAYNSWVTDGSHLYGGKRPYTITATGLPAGARLRFLWETAGCALIDGYPDAISKARDVTLTVTDAAGATASIVIACPGVSDALPQAESNLNTKVYTWAQLKAACEDTNRVWDSIVLMADIVQDGEPIKPLKNTYLDLNGHSLTYSGTAYTEMFSIPAAPLGEAPCQLGLYDTSKEKKGVLHFENTSETNSAAIRMPDASAGEKANSIFVMNSGGLQAGGNSALFRGSGKILIKGGNILSPLTPFQTGMPQDCSLTGGTYQKIDLTGTGYTLGKVLYKDFSYYLGATLTSMHALEDETVVQGLTIVPRDKNSPPLISECEYPSGTVDELFPDYTPGVEYYGEGDPVWSWVGTLPAGTTLNPATGAVNGTPTETGSWTGTLTVTADGKASSQEVTLRVTGSQTASSWEELKTAMENPDAGGITLTGDITAPDQNIATLTLITVEGVKRLDLNGHTVSVSTKGFDGYVSSDGTADNAGGHKLFEIPHGASLTVLDGSGSGTGGITYVDKSTYFEVGDSSKYSCRYNEAGILFDVSGALTIRSGTYVSGDEWTHRQYNGVVVHCAGKTRILGGSFTGRYAVKITDSTTNQSAIHPGSELKYPSSGVVNGYNITIAGGTFLGLGGADAVRFGTDDSSSTIYAGTFRTEGRKLAYGHNSNTWDSETFCTENVRGQSIRYDTASHISPDSRITYDGSVTTTSAFVSGTLYCRDSVVSAHRSPSVAIVPEKLTAHTGVRYTLGANAVPGTGGDLTYQWSMDGNKLSGETGATYTFTAAGSNNESHTYSCTVSEFPGNGSKSADCAVTISTDQVGPTVAISPSAINVMPDGSVTLRAVTTPGSSGDFTYQWSRDGTVIPDAAGAKYTYDVGSVEATETIACTVTDGNSFSATATANVNIFNPMGNYDYPKPAAAVITQQPAAAQNLTAGAAPRELSFAYRLADDETQVTQAAVQWYQRDSSGEETAIAGQTSTILPASCIDTTVTGTVDYFARVTTKNYYAMSTSVDTAACSVTVLPAQHAGAPVFDQNLGGETSWTYGQTGTMTNTIKVRSPNPGIPNLDFHWYMSMDGTNEVNDANPEIAVSSTDSTYTHVRPTDYTADQPMEDTLNISGASLAPGTYRYFCAVTNTITLDDGTKESKTASSGIRTVTVAATVSDEINITVSQDNKAIVSAPNPEATVQGAFGGPVSVTLTAAPTAGTQAESDWNAGQYRLVWHWIDNSENTFVENGDSEGNNKLVLTSKAAAYPGVETNMVFDQMYVWCDIVRTVNGVSVTDTRRVSLTTDVQSRDAVTFGRQPELSINGGAELTPDEGATFSIPVSLSNAQKYSGEGTNPTFDVILWSWDGASFKMLNDSCQLSTEESSTEFSEDIISGEEAKKLTADPSVARYFVMAKGKVGTATNSTFAVEPVDMEYYVKPAAPVIHNLTGFNDYPKSSYGGVSAYKDAIQYLEVKASTSTPGVVLDYQWQTYTGVNPTDAASTWTDITGATQAAYLAPTSTLQPNAEVWYRVQITADNGSNLLSDTVTSKPVYVQVTERPSHIALSPDVTEKTLPVQRLEKGGSLKLSIEAKSLDEGTLSYQWQNRASESSPWNNRLSDDATSDTVTVSPAESSAYRCRVTNSKTGATGYVSPYDTATVYSDLLQVNVYTRNVRTPVRVSGSYVDGEAVTYYNNYRPLTLRQEYTGTGTDTDHVDGTITYQWYYTKVDPAEATNVDILPINGATDSSYTLTAEGVESLQLAKNAQNWFYCKVTSTNDSATGEKSISVESPVLVVNDKDLPTQPSQPTILTPKAASSATYVLNNPADKLTCRAAAQDSDGIVYAWYRTDSADAGLAGATYVASGAEYTPPTTAAGTFYYLCTACNYLQAASSDTMSVPAVSPVTTVTVSKAANTLIPDPIPQMTAAGSPGSVTLNADTVKFQSGSTGLYVDYDAVAPTYTTVSVVSGGSDIFTAAPTLNEGVVQYTIKDTATNGQTATLRVGVSSRDYDVEPVNINITVGSGVTVSGTCTSWNNTDNAVYRLYAGTMTDADIKADIELASPKSGMPAGSMGSITVNSDGKRYDQTFSFATVAPGDYKLAIWKPSHGVFIQELTVSANITQNVDLYLLGDVNMDGKVNSTDAIWIRQKSAGSRIFSNGYQLVLGDVNGDSKINSTDAIWVRQISAGSRTIN